MDEFTIASDDEIEPEITSDNEVDEPNVESRVVEISENFSFEDEVIKSNYQSV